MEGVDPIRLAFAEYQKKVGNPAVCSAVDFEAGARWAAREAANECERIRGRWSQQDPRGAEASIMCADAIRSHFHLPESPS